MSGRRPLGSRAPRPLLIANHVGPERRHSQPSGELGARHQAQEDAGHAQIAQPRATALEHRRLRQLDSLKGEREEQGERHVHIGEASLEQEHRVGDHEHAASERRQPSGCPSRDLEHDHRREHGSRPMQELREHVVA